MKKPPPDVMTLDEVVEYLRIPRSTLYKLAQEGRIPCQKVGRHWRFLKSALDKWIEGNKHSGPLNKERQEPWQEK